MRSTVTTAAHTILSVNGLVFGRCVSLAWNIVTPNQPIQTVDLVEPAELAPGPTIITGRIGVVRTLKDGGADGAGLSVPPLDAARGKYVALEIRDRRTDTTIFRADRCRVGEQAWSVSPKGFLLGSFSFHGITGFGELIPSQAG